MNLMKTLTLEEPFELESGNIINNPIIAYHTYGVFNPNRNNVIWVFHALTANSDVVDWWPSLVGYDKAINPENHFIVCANVLGSVYGTTGPRSKNIHTGEPFGMTFPQFTVRDVVGLQLKLAERLNITQIKMLIGGSFGGFQALEFALMYKGTISHLTLIATSAKETAWSIAIHESQRLTLMADRTLYENESDSGDSGLKAARAIGLLTYRTYEAYVALQTDEDERIENFKAASYIQYQGDKLVNRFHAHSYWFLTKCLDSHNIGRGRGGVIKVLESITIPSLVISLSTDRLVPPAEQKFMADHINGAEYHVVHSDYGHDGFLIEGDQIAQVVLPYV